MIGSCRGGLAGWLTAPAMTTAIFFLFYFLLLFLPFTDLMSECILIYGSYVPTRWSMLVRG